MGDLGLILWNNIFFGYDLFIFVFAVVAGVFFMLAWKSAQRLRSEFRREVVLSAGDNGDNKEGAVQTINPISIQSLIKKRDSVRLFYSWFEKSASIFPMLGILGTVISLLPMVSDIENMQGRFFVALTSTFWGIIFAIICKSLDAPLSAYMEENYDEVDRFLYERKTFKD